MIYDTQSLFSDAQAITATAASTNIINLGATRTPYGGNQLKRDVGKGCEVPLSVTVNQTFATLTSLTITVEIDSTSAFSSPTTVLTTTAIPAATLVAGYQLPIPARLPEGTNKQYVRLMYTVAGSNATAGAITAGIVADRQTNFGGY